MFLNFQGYERIGIIIIIYLLIHSQSYSYQYGLMIFILCWCYNPVLVCCSNCSSFATGSSCRVLHPSDIYHHLFFPRATRCSGLLYYPSQHWDLGAGHAYYSKDVTASGPLKNLYISIYVKLNKCEASDSNPVPHSYF